MKWLRDSRPLWVALGGIVLWGLWKSLFFLLP